MKFELPVSLSWTSAAEEQAWNQEQLLAPLATPQVRLWAYNAPAVVLGCAQHACAAGVAPWSNIDVITRESGGGAVLVGPWMLGMSVALPAGHPLVTPSPVSSYRWLGELCASVLRNLGVAASAIRPEEARSWRARHDLGKDLEWACFGGVSPWEVLARERKLLGLAQLRRRHGVLLVGGLLLEPPDWPLLTRALRRPTTHIYHLTRGTTSLAEELGFAPALLEVAHPLAWALQGALQPTDSSIPSKETA